MVTPSPQYQLVCHNPFLMKQKVALRMSSDACLAIKPFGQDAAGSVKKLKLKES